MARSKRINGVVDFDETNRARLRHATMSLGITFEEFVFHATIQALDEFEADARDATGTQSWNHLAG